MVLALALVVGAALSASSAGQGPPGGTPPGLEKAVAAKQKHAERLLDKPGVAGVAVGLNAAGKPVIRIYKEKKDVEDLPDELEGVSVDSVTTGVIQPYDHAPTHRFPRPVPIGVSAGLSGVATGTLGARVSDGTNTYALSNNHVFAGINSASIGDPIISPGDVDGGSDPGDRIGTLAAYEPIDFEGGTNTMDAAIALTSPADVGTATPSDGYGNPSSVTASASLGLAVQKYGRTTALQPGSVAGTSVSVDVCYIAFGEFCLQEARFAGQISISPGPFSAPGDSGSLVVTQGGNQPVALLFAGGDGLTIATPIDLVLQRFGVTIDGGGPPPPGPPSAPTGLTATPGDGSASLSWTPPSFDGGSSVTGYRIYRGPSAGSVTFHQAVGAVTSFADTGLSNGTTYHYRVSAVNANGEGPLSSAALATPTAFVQPAEPLPVVDGFDRGFENPLSDGGRWSNGISGSAESGLYVPSTWLACSKSSTCTSWRNAAQYGPDVEVWARVSVLPGDDNQIRLLARLRQVGGAAYDGYMLRATQLPGTDQILLERVDDGTFVTRLTVSQELVAGDILLLRAAGSVIEIWRNSSAAWSRLGVLTDTTYAAAGYAGVGIRGTTGRVDDFGARTLGSGTSPEAPAALTAVAGDASVSLSWQAPGSNGGSPVTNYKVYRGTSSGALGFHANAGPTTSTVDASAVNGTTYYYKVSAENANGESGLSNEASATPSSLVTPVEPLPVLDAFNRSENPLSDAGRWSNGITGPVETGLYTTSDRLACSRTTTCTAWRNAVQYGADVEVWARLPVLPGAGNQLRLLARVQQPGTSTYDGYMLRPNQLAGTDQILFERVDNGAFVTLLTVNQELAAGDLFLLRVQGSTIEAWRHNGASWSRLGTVSDATYAAVGYTGVGLRGTTGRADDFGARTMGGPPPDTELPSAPGTLTATALSSSQIDLSWGPATDNVGVTFYRVERCSGSGCSTFAQVASSTSTTHLDVGLGASTGYSYRVRAVDAASNEGPYSNTASATTNALPDTEPPSPPGTLSASAVNSSQIDLTWGAATDNVAVVLYRVERCQGAGCSVFTEVGTTASTSFSNSGLSASTSYSYRVRAQDAVPNTGDYSNTASATTPSDVVAPVEPLPIIDTFNRRNENPLSDTGRWSNGIIGSAETGLRVNSNTLECTRTTTCTAWRNNATFGSDTEVWARISTLPGTNNQFRLYARLQGPGGATHSGYMFRTNQLTGTDEVRLERIDAGAIVTRLTIARELAVGDTLLLRVKGSKLEAWLKRGSSWTLLGSVVDTTYAAAGRVGVGIRGKSGRLDDFGAR